jgi:hypothetical protein
MAYSFLKISTIGSHNSLESADGGGVPEKCRPSKNHQKDKVHARQKENIPVELCTGFRKQKPPSVMVWVGVTMDGRKKPLVFIEEGVKIDQATRLFICTC